MTAMAVFFDISHRRDRVEAQARNRSVLERVDQLKCIASVIRLVDEEGEIVVLDLDECAAERTTRSLRGETIEAVGANLHEHGELPLSAIDRGDCRDRRFT